MSLNLYSVCLVNSSTDRVWNRVPVFRFLVWQCPSRLREGEVGVGKYGDIGSLILPVNLEDFGMTFTVFC